MKMVPWADVRERIERMREAEARGANLAPIDFASRDLLDDADALLMVVDDVVGIIEHWDESPKGSGAGLEGGFYDHLEEARQSISALPKHLKGNHQHEPR